MSSHFPKWLLPALLLGMAALLVACSRSFNPVNEEQATLIDPAPQQTLTELSLGADSEPEESLSENTATATNLPQEPTKTPVPTATKTPSVVPTANETDNQPQTTSTVVGLIPTQTITPVSIQSAGDKLVVNYLEAPPTVDGDIGDWPGTIYAIDQVVFGTEFYANEIDLYGEFKLGWDIEYFYIGVHVRDTRFVQTASGEKLFKGDSIEVLLDTDWSGDLNTDDLSNDDYQIGFSPGNLVEVPLPEAYLWAPSEKAGPLTMAAVNGRLTDDGYMVEIAIAWEELGVNPTDGLLLGFLLSVSDNDSIGKNEQQSVISFSETRNLTNPSTWLPILLVTP